MKFITTLLTVTLLFSTQLFSQDKGGVLQNTGDSVLEKFNELLKQTIVDYEAEGIEQVTIADGVKDEIRELFINHQKHTLFLKTFNSQQKNNVLTKTVLDKRFLLSDQTYQNWDGAAWANSSKYLYSYDSRDNQVQYTYQTWNGTIWVNNSRYSFIFDANDNETEYISQSWSGSAWVNSYKYTSTYDQNNNLVEQVGQNWTGGVWTNSNRYLTTYNSFNKITQETYQTWSGGTWANNTRYIYTYDSNRNMTQYEYQTWNGTTWVNDFRSTSVYNANNKRTEQISLNWNGTTWVNSNKYTITYDANNNQTEYLYQTWDVSVWKNNSKYAYTYNSHNDITGLIAQTWNGTNWVNNANYILAYDARFNMTEILYQTWDVAVWKNSAKYSYVYDANDNNTQYVSQVWDGSFWVNQGKSLYTYITGHYQTTITLNTSYTFEDPTKTTSYQIIGLPGANNLPIANILSGSPGATGDWRAFWDPGTGAYTEYTSSGSTFNFTAGKAFWVISKNTININQSVNAVPMTNDNTYSIPVHSEWNLISNPFNKTISWNSIQNLNSTVQPIHFFQGGSYITPANFEPYKGYYFFNNTGLKNMIIPYSSSVVLPKQNNASINELEIILIDESLQKASINIGVSEQAQEGMDVMDIFSPPSQFSEVSISLINNKLETDYKLLQKDYRPLTSEGLEFDFRVKNISDRKIDMIVNGMDNFTEQEIYLLDKSLFQMYDLKTISSFELRSNITEKKYSLLIGTTDFINQKQNGLIPTEFNLFQNYPNPFNPSTMIMFALPKQSNVSLKIYNILGELVFELINNQTFEAGYHEIAFNGSQLASGIYLYKMETISSDSKQFVETKKMLMIK
jgi:hypothetical protein